MSFKKKVVKTRKFGGKRQLAQKNVFGESVRQLGTTERPSGIKKSKIKSEGAISLTSFAFPKKKLLDSPVPKEKFRLKQKDSIQPKKQSELFDVLEIERPVKLAPIVEENELIKFIDEEESEEQIEKQIIEADKKEARLREINDEKEYQIFLKKNPPDRNLIYIEKKYRNIIYYKIDNLTEKNEIENIAEELIYYHNTYLLNDGFKDPKDRFPKVVLVSWNDQFYIPVRGGFESLLKEREKGNTSTRLLDFYLEPVNRNQLIELMKSGSILLNNGHVQLVEIDPFYQMSITEAGEFVDEHLLPLLEPGDEDTEDDSNSIFVMDAWVLWKSIQQEKAVELNRAMMLYAGKLISELESIKQEALDIQDVEEAERIQKVIDEKNKLRTIPHNPEDVIFEVDYDNMQEKYRIKIKFKDFFTIGKFKEFLLEKHPDLYDGYTFWGDSVNFNRNYTKTTTSQFINQSERTKQLIEEFNNFKFE